MGYLPEALVNYLALLGWGAEDGKTETFTLDELTRAFSLERVTASPAIFDFDKLNWLNRYYLKRAAPERVAALAWDYFLDRLPPKDSEEEVLRDWFKRLVAVFVPGVDHLDQLPARTAFIFGFDPDAARANQENAAVLASDSARIVLAELADRVRTYAEPVTPELFKKWLNEIKSATRNKRKELFHPVRIAITGAHSGPDFDKVLPLIEDGALLGLGIATVRQRVEKFVGV